MIMNYKSVAEDLEDKAMTGHTKAEAIWQIWGSVIIRL